MRNIYVSEKRCFCAERKGNYLDANSQVGKASPKKPSQWTSVFLVHMFSQRCETEKNLRAQERCQRPSPAHPLRGLIIRPRNHNVTTLCGACLPGTMEFCPTVVGRHFSSGTWLCFIESTQHWLLGTWLGGVLSGLGNNKCSSSGTLRQACGGGRPAGTQPEVRKTRRVC